jgi:hypothetical protein
MTDRWKLAQMKQTLAMARVSRDESRRAHAKGRQALEAAERELATIERRGALAAQINDLETVAVAERFAASTREQIARLLRKEAVLLEELIAAERTLSDMESEWRAATGRTAPTGTAAPETPLDEGPTPDPADYRALDDAARAAAAEAKLEELKRKMGRT